MPQKVPHDMKLELWTKRDVPGIHFVTNSYSNYNFSPHFHDEYIILTVDEGVNEGICQKKRYTVSPGNVLLLNPGEVHTGSSFNNKLLRYSALYITPDYIRSFLDHSLTSNKYPSFEKMIIHNKKIAHTLLQTVKDSKRSEDTFWLESQLAVIFGDLSFYSATAQTSELDRDDKTWVRKAKEFICDNYDANFSLRGLSDYIQVSPYHLIRSFKGQTGITPFQFLRNYRIELAKNLLSKGHSIVDAALSVGFYDQSHFHKYFKQITGVTPKEYLRSQQ